jgi:hypothetical protein
MTRKEQEHLRRMSAIMTPETPEQQAAHMRHVEKLKERDEMYDRMGVARTPARYWGSKGA